MCLRENLGEKIEGELLQKMPQMPFFLILRIGVFIIIFVTFRLLVCTKCILVGHANISNLDFFSRFFSSDFDDSFKGLSELRLT